MAFLSSVVGYVVTAVLSALGGWLLKMLHTWNKDRTETAANEAQTEAARKALEEAVSKEELEKAAKGISDGF